MPQRLHGPRRAMLLALLAACCSGPLHMQEEYVDHAARLEFRLPAS